MQFGCMLKTNNAAQHKPPYLSQLAFSSERFCSEQMPASSLPLGLTAPLQSGHFRATIPRSKAGGDTQELQWHVNLYCRFKTSSLWAVVISPTCFHHHIQESYPAVKLHLCHQILQESSPIHIQNLAQ